jgi:hypothetical protein
MTTFVFIARKCLERLRKYALHDIFSIPNLLVLLTTMFRTFQIPTLQPKSNHGSISFIYSWVYAESASSVVFEDMPRVAILPPEPAPGTCDKMSSSRDIICHVSS